MKYHFIYILLLNFLCSSQIFAQQSFEKTISDPEDQVINHIIEDSEGGFIMIGKKHNIETGYPSGYIIKIDSIGNLIQSKIIQYSDTNTHILFNIHYLNNSYYILGYRQFISTVVNKLWFLKLNTNLEMISEEYFNIPSGKWISYMNSIIDSDSNIIMTGYTTHYDTLPPVPYKSNPFFFKCTLNGDSVTSRFLFPDYHLSMSYDIIEKDDQTGYYSYGFKYSSSLSSGGQRYNLTKQFDSLGLVEVPYNISLYTSSAKLNDSTIIISGGGGISPTPSYSLNVLSTTMGNIPIDYNYFKIEGDMRDYTATYQGISRNGNSIYVGGTSNYDYTNPFWSTNDSWFHLIKINPDISPIWEYWYGGDAYYHLYSIIATSDGGCLMVGNRYDYETQNQERDIYIVKVDSNGLITWTQEISIKKPESTVYPNPGTNLLNIKSSNKELDFELININGQVVIRQILKNNNSKINTESLKSGMYFYRLNDTENKTIETGKWIKK